MASIQKLELEVAEVKCSANNFYGLFKNNINKLVEHFPENYQSVEVIEGDGASVGSARLWKYELERTTAVNDESKSIAWNFYGGAMMDHYNSFGFTLVSVTPKGEGCCSVKWSVEFEKANENVPTPNAYGIHVGLSTGLIVTDSGSAVFVTVIAHRMSDSFRLKFENQF
ncbi:major latex protein 146-like [Papaver somniferum]|uniref:major latex protein 146-like n=1 Tax=Papaver somniferum TaxID=3469 RepID=UPI000E6F7F5C|nr:major latex protein 146-like [Papaver somniferum]